MAVVEVKAQLAEGLPLCDGGKNAFEYARGRRELAAHVQIHVFGADDVGGDGQTFEHEVGATQQHVAIFERTGLAFVGVEHHVAGRFALRAHRAPLGRRQKARATSALQARLFETLEHVRRTQALGARK